MRAAPLVVAFSSLLVSLLVSLLASLLVAANVAAEPDSKSKTKKTPAAGAAANKTTPGAPAPSAPGTAGSPSSGSAAPGSPATSADGAGASQPDLAAVKPEDMPTAVRLRRLEQNTQALKERAWQLKARVQMLKEQMIGGGVGAQAVIAHTSEMGASFRLIKLIYTLDGTQVFARTDDTAEHLYKTSAFDVFAGPISPGNHTLSVVAAYRGHGYGVFEYLSKYTFTARGNQAFIAGEGKITKIDCRGLEKGGPTTPLEKRAAIECKVTQVQPERADKPDRSDKPERSDKPADRQGESPGAPVRGAAAPPSRTSASPAPPSPSSASPAPPSRTSASPAPPSPSSASPAPPSPSSASPAPPSPTTGAPPPRRPDASGK